MQPIIRKFVRDLKKEIKKSAYKNKIISVVLLGSAARDEWIKGESDIDIIVVVRHKKEKADTTRFFSSLLKKLNKKHKLKLEETTAEGKKHDSTIINSIMKIEAFVFFGVPFYVVSLDDYDFFKNKIKDPKVWFLATFLGSINTFLLSVKNTAKIIYGKNLLRNVDVRLSFFDRIMLDLEQVYIILASFLVLPFDSKTALKHAMKASLYQEEFDLLLLHKHTKGYFKDEKLYDKLFKASPFVINHLRKTLYYRRNYKSLHLSKAEVTEYIFSTMAFLNENNKKLDNLLQKI